MTVAFVNDNTVTNGTAGTSVTVSKPTGTVDDHALVAFIATVGAARIRPPDDTWKSLGTRAAGAAVRIAGWWKIADSEPASWTWTLDASQRNWGWVGTYSGVDLIEPAYDMDGEIDPTADTAYAFTADNAISLTDEGAGVSAVAAVRTASGVATTWTGSGTEQADLSTNAGSGTDIAGQAQHTIYTAGGTVTYQPSWTASQTQTAAAMLAVTLRPAVAFTAYSGGRVSRSVEVAWGADPDGDPDLWTWTDITQDLLDDGSITVTVGRDERGAIDQPANPTRVELRLRNWRSTDGVTRTNEGQYTPDNPDSSNYPNVVQYVPLRVVQPYGYGGSTVRYTVFVDSWAPSWDASGRAALVDVAAYGRLQRLRDEAQPVRSVLRRVIEGFTVTGVQPHAYYPCEDGSGSTRIASAIAGHQPLQPNLNASMAAASDLGGSAALPTLAHDGVIGGALGPGYTATGQWCLLFVAKLPDTPVTGESRLVSVRCDGTAMDWSLWLVPGSPDTLNLRAVTWGSSLLDDSVAIVEADHYGQWRLYTIGVTQNGANVDYASYSAGATAAVGNTGTLNSRTIGSARTVRFVAFTNGLAGMAIGHVALYTDPAFDLTNDPLTIAFAALEGNAGDHPITRFRELCAQLDIPFTTYGSATESTDLGMGPQAPGAIGDLLQEAVDVDHGFGHDADPSGALVLRARDSVYNQLPVLILDGDLGQIPADVRPVFDGQGRITDSTVTRDGGSSARYAATDARGGKPDAKTLSLENDLHLYPIAGWRTTLGNQPAMRYTALPFNLRRSPELLERWFRSGIGTRMQATAFHSSLGPSEPDGIIVGWTEAIRRDAWTVVPVLAHARPYDVPVMESGDEKTWRLDTGGSELASSATSSATSLSVATTGERLWTTAAGSLPFDVDIGGERITVTAVSGASSPQTFTVTRGVAGGAAAKAHAAGDAVRLWRPRGLAL